MIKKGVIVDAIKVGGETTRKQSRGRPRFQGKDENKVSGFMTVEDTPLSDKDAPLTEIKEEFLPIDRQVKSTVDALITESGRAAAGMDEGFVKSYVRSLYSGNLPQISAKEMLQNATDSVRGLDAKNQTGKKVRIDIPSSCIS